LTRRLGATYTGCYRRRREMPSTKKQALEMIKKLPEKASWDDIIYEI
jgi:hypothetical protein